MILAFGKNDSLRLNLLQFTGALKKADFVKNYDQDSLVVAAENAKARAKLFITELHGMVQKDSVEIDRVEGDIFLQLK